MKKAILALLIAVVPVSALAAQQVTLTSTVAIVRTKAQAGGPSVTTYETPKSVTPGDKLALALHWANASAKSADHFVVTDPIPSGLVYADSASSGAEVSVDGGKTFGSLGALKVTDAQGHARAAQAADVTHVRWSFGHAIAPGEQGELKFEAFVK